MASASCEWMVFVCGCNYDESISLWRNYGNAIEFFDALIKRADGRIKVAVQNCNWNNFIVWANAIVYDYRVQLSAGHNDDISVAGFPDDGWGWLIDLGVDMIQTDWTGMLRQYMNTKYCSK